MAAAKWQRGGPQREAVAGVSRYSRFVGLMRWLLPAVAVALALMILAWPTLMDDLRDLPPAQVGRTEMLNPRYTGRNDSGYPFVMTATKAQQASESADIINLVGVDAKAEGAEGRWTRLKADTGVYNRVLNTVALSGNVNLTNREGYDIVSPSALLLLKEGRAEGNEVVTGKGPLGKINAKGFRVEDEGKTVVFIGRSRLDLKDKKEAR